MRSDQNSKWVVLGPSATTTISTLTAAVDTRGFNYITIFAASTSAGALNSSTAIEHSDDNSTWVAMPGVVYGVDYVPTTATNATTEAKFLMNIDLRGRKRYLKITVQHATAGDMKLIANLSSPTDGITDAASAGTTNFFNL